MSLKNQTPQRALVTDIERRKVLPIIRSLARKSIEIHGLSSKRLPLGSFSKYCSKTYHSPDYTNAPSGFLKYFSDLLDMGFDVLFPMEEELIYLLLKNPSYWQNKINAVLPSLDSFEIAQDKWKTIVEAKNHNIPVPDSYLPTSLNEAIDISKKFENGAVLKPRKGSGSRGIVFADSRNGITKYFEDNPSSLGQAIVQEKIPQDGAGLGVFLLLDRENKVNASFGHQRIREFPISGGPSTLCKSYRDDGLIKQSISLAQSLELTGISMIEYKFNPNTGTPVLMEINPRFWGSLQLAIFAGINFPELYFDLSLGKKVEAVTKFEENLFFRWLLPGDILHFIKNPNRLHLNPSFFSFNHKATTYAVYDPKDLLPSIGIFGEALRKLLT